MSLARTPDPAEDLGGELIRTHPSAALTVTVVVPTRPGDHLRGSDRRRLARRVLGAERRLARSHPPSATRRRIVRRLWDLAEQANRRPTASGLALIAGSLDGRCITLHQPVVERVLVGRAPTYDGLIEVSWGLGRVAVLHLTSSGCRLVCAEGARLWESGGNGDRDQVEPSVLGAAKALLTEALPAGTPVVVAGDDRCVRAFEANVSHPAVSLSLPGDHSGTSMATLAALAHRALRHSLEPDQRDAMVSLALSVERGTAVRGADAVAAALPTVGSGMVMAVEVGARGSGLGRHGTTVGERALRHGVDVVVLPDGLLAAHDRIALVRRTRPDEPAQVTAPPPPLGRLHAVR